MRDLYEEFFVAGIMPLRQNWGSVVIRDPAMKTRSFDVE